MWAIGDALDKKRNPNLYQKGCEFVSIHLSDIKEFQKLIENKMNFIL